MTSNVKTTVIIVRYNTPLYEKECVHQVMEKTDTNFNLRVYDNYPDDEYLSVVWNRLIEQSQTRYICLLNPDVMVQDNWLERLEKALDDNEIYGAVGPITNSCGSLQAPFSGPQKDMVVDIDMLSGFCMLIRRDVWEKVGGFDEEYELYGEDSDFCMKVKEANFRLGVDMGTWVYHFRSKSSEKAEKNGKDIEAIKRRSVNRYNQKWHAHE